MYENHTHSFVAHDLHGPSGSTEFHRGSFASFVSAQCVSVPVAPATVKNVMAPRATMARNEGSPWHPATMASDANMAPPATLATLAMVKGELRLPNTICFRLFPTLDPFAKAVYFQLFLLSHGFRRDTCIIGLAKLTESVRMSQRKVQNAITYLEKRGLIARLRQMPGGLSKGNIYQVPLPGALSISGGGEPATTGMAPHATLAPHAIVARDATLAQDANNKEKNDDDNKNQSSSERSKLAIMNTSACHSGEASSPGEHNFARVRSAYEKATGNRWRNADTDAYEKHGLEHMPSAKIVSVLEAVSLRTPTKINSFRYFIKEILAVPNDRNRAWQKKQLEKIVRKIRDNSVGLAGYSSVDFLEDVKCACAREGIIFNDDVYNNLIR